MQRVLRENGLSLVMFGLFLISFLGQTLTGHHTYNNDQQEHGQKPISYTQYLSSGYFIEATFENWESEFLQMGAFVLLTVWLRQKGSPESKKLDEEEPVDADPRDAKSDPSAPRLIHRGELATRLYENSLAIALFGLFFLSFALHTVGRAMEYNHEQVEHGGETVSVLAFAATAEFWFQSLQNWQSEFLSIGVLVVLSIFLRQKGSPESNPVAAPHSQTGQ
jgi:hypothetical protein